jgi:hypothetical protein
MPSSKQKRKLISVRVPVQVFDELGRRADSDGRKVGPFASFVLTRYAFPSVKIEALSPLERRSSRAAAGSRRR